MTDPITIKSLAIPTFLLSVIHLLQNNLANVDEGLRSAMLQSSKTSCLFVLTHLLHQFW